MQLQIEDPVQEIKRLQRCINDLVSVLALPAVWSGSEPSQIVQIVLDALVRTLSLDFAHAQLKDPIATVPVEILHVGDSCKLSAQSEEIRAMLSHRFGGDGNESLPLRTHLGDADISIVPVPLGVHGEIGTIVVGSERADFPGQTENLLLSVAANQASIGLREASLLSEQKRIANELEQRVAERTAGLAAANEELRREIAERKLKEEELQLNEEALREAHMQVARSEERWRSVFENSAVGVALTDLTGRFIATNPVYQKMLGYTEEELQQLSFLDITVEEHRNHNWTLIEELVAGKRRQFEIEKQYQRKNGSLVWVRNSVSVVPGTARVPRFFMALSEDITERKHAEEAIRASEVELRQVIDTIPTLAWCNLPDGPNEFLNKGWHEYTGLSPEESHGWGWQVAFHPEDLPPLMEKWQEMLVSGEHGEIEARLRRYDGVYRWFLIRAEPLRDEAGKILRWYGTSTDIEDRKKVEEALRASERNARLILDNMPGLVARLSPAGAPEIFNQPFLEYLGKTVEEIGQWKTNDIIHHDDLARTIEVFDNAIATGEPFDFEYRLRRFDGVYRWFQSRGCPLRDAQGRILHWYALVTDIDDRKQAEDHLRRDEAFLAEGQRLSLTGSFCWKVATDEITWSEQLYRIFEFEPSTPITLEQIRTRVHPEDSTLLEKMVEQARNGCNDFEWQYRLVMPDHSIKYLHAVAHATRDRNGQLEYIAAIQDVTARRLSEEALSRARSELAKVARVTSLGVLTASIAHEVNQPLSGIITNASTCLRMLSADPPNIDGARETARRTIRDGNRASDVITRLRTLYSKKDPEPELMDLNEAAREVTSMSLSELQRNRVILQSEFAEDLPLVVGDRIQLQQVILNLLRNAWDAMTTVEDHPRELVIRTERDGGNRVRLSVQDAGVGFKPHVADQLFEAFYTTKTDGMGIGLSISRSIIEAHQGRLWATANDGHGATFSFAIPCRLKGSSDAETRASRDDPASDAA